MDYSASSRLSLAITLVSSFLLTLPLPKSSLPSSITNDSLPYDCPLGTVTQLCKDLFNAHDSDITKLFHIKEKQGGY